MVIIVAAVLSSWTIWLKPFQEINIEMEKKQNILQSIGIELSREESAEEYDFYIKEEILGPVNAPIFKLNQKYRCRILLRSKKDTLIQKKLAIVLKKNKNFTWNKTYS